MSISPNAQSSPAARADALASLRSSGRARRGRPVIAVLEHLPECCEELDDETAALARRCVAPHAVLAPGPWKPPMDPRVCRGWLGLLVVKGLLTRTVEIDGMRSQELLGPGDVLRPWDDEPGTHTLAVSTAWHVHERASVALLDAGFAARAARWPSIGAALLRAATRRADAGSVLLTVARARRAERRLMLLFWHLADRWGRVTPRGVHIPMPLTHAVISELVCLRRPTVSMALSQLQAGGQLARAEDRSWLLLQQAGTALRDAA